MSKKIDLSELAAQLLTGINIEDPSIPRDEFYRDAKKTEVVFTEMVEFLRDTFPNPTIQKVGTALWESVHTNKTPVAIYQGIPSLHFAGIAKPNGYPIQGAILAPPKWTDLVKKDSVGQFGGLVWVGSKVVDYNHHRMKSPPDAGVEIRARAYEAEFLLTAKEVFIGWKPNSDYQERLLADYPQGIHTPGISSLMYSF